MICCGQTQCWAVFLPVLLCFFGDAVAESGWPPFAIDIRQEFVAHKHRLESIESRMQRESYTELDVVKTWEVTGSRRVDNELQFEKPENPDSWLDDLFPLRISNVKQTNSGYRFSRARPVIDGETVFEVIYFHGNITGLLECSTSFSSVDCGYCTDSLSDRWTTMYYWTPTGLSARFADIPYDTELEEAYASKLKELKACESKGQSELATLKNLASEESD